MEGAPRYIAIGNRIRAARVAAGMSQEQFALAIGSSRRHLIRLERGEHRPGRPLLEQIAAVTGREIGWFDPEAEPHNRQLAMALLDLLHIQVRDLVRAELAAAAEEGDTS